MEGWEGEYVEDEITDFWRSVLDERHDEMMAYVMSRIMRVDGPPIPLINTQAQPLTRETLERAMQQILDAPAYQICYPNEFHMVSPHDDPTKDRRCCNCGATIPPALED